MAKKRKNGRFQTYRSYQFTEKDPIIDALRTVVSETHTKYTALHDDSGVSYTTIRNWFHGSTRRPQFATVSAVARALGKNSIHYTRQGMPYFSTIIPVRRT